MGSVVHVSSKVVMQVSARVAETFRRDAKDTGQEARQTRATEFLAALTGVVDWRRRLCEPWLADARLLRCWESLSRSLGE